jgi:hypothetical protein
LPREEPSAISEQPSLHPSGEPTPATALHRTLATLTHCTPT